MKLLLIKFTITAAFILFFSANSLFAQDEEIPELNRLSFVPSNAKVNVGGHIQLRVISVSAGDTAQVGSEAFENWMVNGKPDAEHLQVQGEAVVYSPGDNKPTVNPVAVTCQYKRKDGETKQTLVANVEVIDDQSGFMLDDAYHQVDPLIGIYSTGSGLTALTFMKGTMGISISIKASSAGIYDFSKESAVGISNGLMSMGSAKENGEPTSGVIEIKEYGKAGDKLKVNIMGILTDRYNGSHYISGTFIITRSPDTP